ncbi:putative xylogalacturonan beta-1,3-xylosyltransferase [Helianthus annuus]|nr:putative xylogalacturonan beta-1,3-xylosyltransferase [Helianthus annuus]
MKLMEKNKNFVVKDPTKAHLFYLPFSSLKLRNTTSHERNPTSRKDLEHRLKDYASLIAGKYPFWNRTNGADHFLVACHDWVRLLSIHIGNEPNVQRTVRMKFVCLLNKRTRTRSFVRLVK